MSATDIMWSSTDDQRLPRSLAAAPADRHGRVPGQDHGGHYGPNGVGRVLVEKHKCGLAVAGSSGRGQHGR